MIYELIYQNELLGFVKISDNYKEDFIHATWNNYVSNNTNPSLIGFQKYMDDCYVIYGKDHFMEIVNIIKLEL